MDANDGLYQHPESGLLYACNGGIWAKLIPEIVEDPAEVTLLASEATQIWPPKPLDQTEQLMQAMDNFAKMADLLAGFRTKLIAQGFTPEQASEIVTHSLTRNSSE